MLVTIGRISARITTAAGAVVVVVARPVVRKVVALVLDEVDLTALVRDNVDLDALIANVDLDALMAKVDLNALMSTVDIDAIIGRVDFESIVQQVLQTIDIGAIIRESSESVTSDAVQSVRTRGSEADVAIGRTVDRLLRRRPHPVG